jgi:hypothetical protein
MPQTGDAAWLVILTGGAGLPLSRDVREAHARSWVVSRCTDFL